MIRPFIVKLASLPKLGAQSGLALFVRLRLTTRALLAVLHSQNLFLLYLYSTGLTAQVARLRLATGALNAVPT